MGLNPQPMNPSHQRPAPAIPGEHEGLQDDGPQEVRHAGAGGRDGADDDGGRADDDDGNGGAHGEGDCAAEARSLPAWLLTSVGRQGIK